MNIKFLTLIGFTAVLCFSCAKAKEKKNWTCSCDVNGLSASGTYTANIEQKTSSEASSDCTNYGKNLTGGNGTYKCSTTVQ